MLQAITPNDTVMHYIFYTYMMARIEENKTFLSTMCFSHNATFHVSRKVNRHNICIWGCENPNVAIKNSRESPKLNISL
jgi:hypothetical protein